MQEKMPMQERNNKAKKRASSSELSGALPKLPADYDGAQYGNHIAVSASAQEIFVDLFQVGPQAGGRAEGIAVFVGRFIFPIAIAKSVLSGLQGIIEAIEQDKQIVLPEQKEK